MDRLRINRRQALALTAMGVSAALIGCGGELGTNDRMRIVRLQFPVQPDHAPDNASSGWLPVIAGLQKGEIVDLLERRWSVFAEEYLQAFSAAILGRELLCLSIDSHGSQWLSFEDGDSALHLAPPETIPQRLHSLFPFHRIPGLAEFVENFGGLANWTLPPCGWFTPAQECDVVGSTYQDYDWGAMGEWRGALTLYTTCGGNWIVISPDNRCAKWDHDVGWGTADDPFESLGWTMSEMVTEFLAYVSLDETAAEECPFYY